jgi:NAD(P)-dependent dehydrogenase (short-subunit alcohol dehydrogenase family)
MRVIHLTSWRKGSDETDSGIGIGWGCCRWGVSWPCERLNSIRPEDYQVNKNHKRVVLIAGASSGIGQACANHLHQKGYQMYGTTRRARPQATAISEAEDVYLTAFEMIQMDVDNDRSVARGVEFIWDREGRLDVVVNCAGFGVAGSVEDTTIAEAKSQFETNFFGAVRLCRAALPIMREQQSGYIVNISSIAGLIGIPFQGMYNASKFALEGMTEALRMEVQPFGIHVVLIEPGDFHTQFTANRRKTVASQQNAVYLEQFTTALGVMEADETQGPSPVKVAYLLERIIESPSPRLRYPVGPVYEKVAITLKKVLPSRFFEWGLMKYYRLL